MRKGARAAYVIAIVLLLVILCKTYPTSATSADPAQPYSKPISPMAYVYDDTGTLGSEAEQTNTSITTFVKSRHALIFLNVSSRNFNAEDDFKNHGRALYIEHKLDSDGIPSFNVLIYIAKINDKPFIGYFHSYNCSIFARKMKTLVSGNIDSIDANIIEQKINDVKDAITYALDIGGKECILNVCELINDDKDDRYKGFECEKIDSSNPKRAHTCAKGDKSIKCLYEEAYKIKESQNPQYPNEQKEAIYGGTVFLIDDSNWHAALSLLPIAVYHRGLENAPNEQSDIKHQRKDIVYNPWIVYHREDDSIDFDSALILLK